MCIRVQGVPPVVVQPRQPARDFHEQRRVRSVQVPMVHESEGQGASVSTHSSPFQRSAPLQNTPSLHVTYMQA